MTDTPIIHCPLDCIAAFSEVQEYGHPRANEVLKEDAVYTPKILDIGANIGAFAIWSKHQWPNSAIFCYEPNMRLQPFLKHNTERFGAAIFCAAVTTEKEPVLFLGDDTALCSSLHRWQRASMKFHLTQPIHPSTLPVADIVKIDTEGSELDILQAMTFTPKYLAVEYHSEELRDRCRDVAVNKMNMELVEPVKFGTPVGLLKFVRKK